MTDRKNKKRVLRETTTKEVKEKKLTAAPEYHKPLKGKDLVIIELHRTGVSQRDIANVLHMGQSTICRKLQQYKKDGYIKD